MDDLAFCPKCGRRRGEDEEYCPKCGRAFTTSAIAASLSTESPPPLRSTRSRVRDFIVAGLILGALVLGYMGLQSIARGDANGMFAQLVPIVSPGPACNVAQQQVNARHSTMFGLMRTALSPFWFTCERVPQPETTAVVVHWTWQGKERRGTYFVLRSLEVQPGDNNAALLDRAAGLGPTAIRMLMGGL